MQWCGKVGEVSRDRIFNLFLESKSAFGYDKHIITEIQTTISRKSNPGGQVGFAGTNSDKQHNLQAVHAKFACVALPRSQIF